MGKLSMYKFHFLKYGMVFVRPRDKEQEFEIRLFPTTLRNRVED